MQGIVTGHRRDRTMETGQSLTGGDEEGHSRAGKHLTKGGR